MKIIYFAAIALFYVLSLSTYGQNLITGGDMEDPEAWEVTLLNTDADNIVGVEYEFGYTDVTPAEGDGGCLYVSGTNTGTTGGLLTNVMFYQLLNLQRGVTYIFDGAYKDFRTNNYWTEVWVGGNEPEEGSDYAADQGAVLVSAFKSSNWETSCLSDEFDGTFQNDACVAGITNQVFFEGEGDTLVYFGFRSGIWDDAGSGYTFEVYFDNISLKAEGTSAISDVHSDHFAVAPNPFHGHIIIGSAIEIKEVSIFNVVGKQVYHKSDLQAATLLVNLSDEDSGVYFIRLVDVMGNTVIRKTIKL
jgi:hypothetical protein